MSSAPAHKAEMLSHLINDLGELMRGINVQVEATDAIERKSAKELVRQTPDGVRQVD